jgi:hypothetical protein
MSRESNKVGEEYQKVISSFGEVNRAVEGFASEMTDYSRKAVGRAIEFQAQFATNAYDRYVSQVSRLGQMFFAGYDTLIDRAEELRNPSLAQETMSSYKRQAGRQRAAAQRIATQRKTGTVKRRSTAKKAVRAKR